MLAADPPHALESRAHVAAHLLREIEGAVRDVLILVPDETTSQRRGRAKKGDEHRKEIVAILTALGVNSDEPWAKAWLALADKSSEITLHKFAHRAALGPPRRIDQEFREFWGGMEAILDIVLDTFEAQYLTVFNRLDALLQKRAPTDDDLQMLRHNVPHNRVARGYFLDRLDKPGWLAPLAARGFFEDPPGPERDEEEGTVHFPPWPGSRFLVKMAKHAPEVVKDIALKMPETDNIRVHEDLADAALAMPADLAAALVPKAKRWLESAYHLTLPEKLGALVAHLAQGGRVSEAVDLARFLLAVLPDRRAAENKTGDDSLRLPQEPGTRFRLHSYEEITQKHLPVLIENAGEPAFELLCDLLEEALGLSRRRPDDAGPEDYSYIWHPAIEQHKRSLRHDPKNLLVSAVRDAAERIARTDATRVPVLVQKLEARRWSVFHRIGLHLLRLYASSFKGLVAHRLTDRASFEASEVQREYALLLRDGVDDLSPADQNTILSWIEAGPDLSEQVKARHEEMRGKPLTGEDVARLADLWRLRHLRPIRDKLTPEWRKRYEALVAELGEPADPELIPHSTATWIGPTSPLDAEALRAMSVEEIAAFLKSWQPSGESMSPSPEGLGRILTEVVASDPKPFAARAVNFEGLDPTYVRALISGLRDAADKKNTFPWPPVLDLCRWILEQAREIPGRTGAYADLDPGWIWTRKAIAELLSSGFGEGAAEIPIDLRADAWGVLNPLTDDPNPTPEDEVRDSGDHLGPATLSINTTRGEALHSVVRYALWVRRHVEKTPGGVERIAHGFQEMPEVRECLETHLDPGRDPSPAIRSVYGRWFPWLVLLDREWAKAKISAVFPSAEEHRSLYRASWETYITFCHPYDDVFDVLAGEYRRAVEQIGPTDSERRQPDDQEERLAEHLVTLYWRGKISLDEQDGLLARFYEKADGALRARAIECVGHSLHNRETPQVVPPRVLERLRAFWVWRLEVARAASSPASHAQELGAFGWWFVSGRFDDTWSMDRLLESLRLGWDADPNHVIVERLAALAPAMPMPAVECLELIIEGDKEGWRIHGWRAEARAILAAAVKSGDERARRSAVDLINRLSARGNLDFRDLI